MIILDLNNNTCLGGSDLRTSNSYTITRTLRTDVYLGNCGLVRVSFKAQSQVKLRQFRPEIISC